MNFPILSSLILLPIIGALFLFFTKDKDGNNLTAKYVSLFTTIVNFLISIYLWISFDQSTSSFQFIEDREWIDGFINYKVGVDGISILFIILTTFITPLCIISVNNTIKVRLRDFLIAILIMESFMIGVFCALDLVVFYLFFEAGLIPMFLIIGIWGGPKRVYSAFKFFLYTLLGSVLMLVAIISIYWISGTTDVIKLYELGIDAKYQNLLWLAFFSSFAVKTPMWPVHTWLPDAHVEAPTADLYYLLRYCLDGWLWFYKIFTWSFSNCIRNIYTFNIYLKRNCDRIYILNCSNAGRHEKINCILICCSYGFCNLRNIYNSTTRY